MYHFEPDDDTFSGFQTHGLPAPFYNYADDCFTVAGCVNGVLCLVDDFRSEGTLIILWNPAIRKFVHLPRPTTVVDTYGPYESVCGFGFDPISDDYKVVRLVDLHTRFEASSGKQVEVYSLKSGCWRVIGVGPCYSFKHYAYGYTPRCINGSVYWLASPYVVSNCETVLLKFDMSAERFETIQLPGKNESTFFTQIRDLYIQESNQMLALIKSNYNDASKTCSAWILKEDGIVKSWINNFNFDIAKLRPHGMPLAFSFRKTGEVIMVNSGRGGYPEEESGVVSVDPVTESGSTLREINAEYRSFYLSTYVESMVLFKEGKRIEEQNTPLDLLRVFL